MLKNIKPNFNLDYVVVKDFEVGPYKVHVGATDGKDGPNEATK